MPRWPEKDKVEEKPQEPETVLENPAGSVILDGIAIAALHMHMDSIVAHLEQLHTEVRGPMIALPAEPVERKLQRRRTEDEMRSALRMLSSGQARPRDDDSIQVLEDTFAEVFALRQLNMDLMQASSTAYQQGIAAIRALTSR